MYIDDINVTVNGTLAEDEVLRVVEEEKAIFKANGKTLGGGWYNCRRGVFEY